MTVGLLAVVTVLAWVDVVRQTTSERMAMPMGAADSAWSVGGAAAFVGAWAIMMAAMMLPSALPMIALYQAVRQSRSAGNASLPTWGFTLVYLLVWTLVGVPVYVLHQVLAPLVEKTSWGMALQPLLPGALLVAAGLYQFSPLKRRCVTACRSPLGFYLTFATTGTPDPLALGLRHALYCLGCCVLLMSLLVFVGAMSLPWVLGLSLMVLLEKTCPWKAMSAAVGLVLLLAGVAALVAAGPSQVMPHPM